VPKIIEIWGLKWFSTAKNPRFWPIFSPAGCNELGAEFRRWAASGGIGRLLRARRERPRERRLAAEQQPVGA
jgi:hypothetical protein